MLSMLLQRCIVTAMPRKLTVVVIFLVEAKWIMRLAKCFKGYINDNCHLRFCSFPSGCGANIVVKAKINVPTRFVFIRLFY